MRPVPRPSELEILSNLLLGPDAEAPPLPDAPGRGVLAALEQALLEPLQHTPCVVSFSGGRDSSAILAVATDVARRHGLPLPVPVTMRFPKQPTSDETTWQALVLEHLGLTGEVVTLHHELDALGPVAKESLGRLGVRWPGNTYLHAPVLELGRGGTLLTGVGGDELMGSQASRHVILLRGRDRPRRADLRTVARDLRPRRFREAAWRRANGDLSPWLTPAGEDLVYTAMARDDLSWPHRWDHALKYWQQSRAFAAVRGMIGLYGEPYDVDVVHPLLDPHVMAELHRVGGPTGFPGRTAAMRALFGELLPDGVLERGTKAAFTGAVFGPEVRAFAERWDGTGINLELVDPERLRSAWLSDWPNSRSLLLLHQAYLAGQSAASS
jgi:asparagine synthase (glutamine-hydrolysing)